MKKILFLSISLLLFSVTYVHAQAPADTRDGGGDAILLPIFVTDALFAQQSSDTEPYTPADLSDVTWTWQRVVRADGSIYTPYSSPTFSPTVRFGTEEHSNASLGERSFRGDLSCNRQFGSYIANEENGLQFFNILTTEALCIIPEQYESEWYGINLLQSTYRFEGTVNELHLITEAGERMIFTRESE